MAVRPCFRALSAFAGVRRVDSAPFIWHGGFALSQKQKNVAALHDAVRVKLPNANVLEISSKSLQPLGVALSAFNLMLEIGGKKCSVESVFQASKVFRGNDNRETGPFPNLYPENSKEVRKFVHEIADGKRLVAFALNGTRWQTEPKTAFYDHLYISALIQNPQLADELMDFDTFTDIEFNPERQLNCQAYAAALYVSLRKTEKLEEVMNSLPDFLKLY